MVQWDSWNLRPRAHPRQWCCKRSSSIGAGQADNAFSLSIGGNGPAAGRVADRHRWVAGCAGHDYVGNQNNATLTINAGLVQTDNVQLGNTVWSADGSTSTTYTGKLTLNGGVLSVGEIVLGGGSAGAWTNGGSVTMNGGTIRANGSLLINAPITLNSGGGTIDTNGSTGVISSVVSGTGGLTKQVWDTLAV